MSLIPGSTKHHLLTMVLPADVRVIDCAYCGALATNDWKVYKKFQPQGLKLAGGWLPERNGHRRPLCMGCFSDHPRQQTSQLIHRTEAQANRLKKFFERHCDDERDIK